MLLVLTMPRSGYYLDDDANCKKTGLRIGGGDGGSSVVMGSIGDNGSHGLFPVCGPFEGNSPSAKNSLK